MNTEIANTSSKNWNEGKNARKEARKARIAHYSADLKHSIVSASAEFIKLVQDAGFPELHCKMLRHIPELGGYYIGTRDQQDYSASRKEIYTPQHHILPGNALGEYTLWLRLKVQEGNIYYCAKKELLYVYTFLSSKQVLLIEKELYNSIFPRQQRVSYKKPS